jgi:uncharacterized protein (DUF1015 family)
MENLLRKVFLVRDEEKSYYLYKQEKDGFEYLGIIAAISIDEYLEGRIKIHEATLTQREEKLREYLKVCDYNAEPVLFFYTEDAGLKEIKKKISGEEPEYFFSTSDAVRHSLWKISDSVQVEAIQKCFEKMPCVYIADGHHRSASSALLGKEMREKNPGYTGSEGWNYYMGVFFPNDNLNILPFHRLVKSDGTVSLTDVLERISKHFEIKETGNAFALPGTKGEIHLFHKGKGYALRAKIRETAGGPVSWLDAEILNRYILEPCFGIKDLKNDPTIEFIPGTKTLKQLKGLSKEGNGNFLFLLYPSSIDEIKAIADAGEIMPPKTTWVEPKMRNGLVIYSLSDHS